MYFVRHQNCKNMAINYLKFANKYQKIINEIENLSIQLTSEHAIHLQCKKGCDLCCMDYSIFFVEFYIILNRLKQNEFQPKIKEKNDEVNCIFLKNHSCTIYENRPVICRTHGLPLLYMNEHDEWELSNCELNFTEYDFENFNAENTFPMDEFNSKLFVLNKKFIAQFEENKYDESDLIPLKKLVEHFK